MDVVLAPFCPEGGGKFVGRRVGGRDETGWLDRKLEPDRETRFLVGFLVFDNQALLLLILRGMIMPSVKSNWMPSLIFERGGK